MDAKKLVAGYYRPIDIQRFKFVISKIPSGIKTILDVGARDNTFKRMLERENYRVTALDIAPRHKDVLKGDTTNLEFKNNSFDLVTALETLEHLQEVQLPKALREIQRVAKKAVIISVPNKEVPLGTGHHIFFDEARVKSLFRTKKVNIYYFGKRLKPIGIRRTLCKLSPKIGALFTILFGKKGANIPNWIIGVFELDKK